LGLGLASSKRIVEQLDGTIAVESEVGRGTKFTMRFPASGQSVAAAS
jgi:two-component system phosphate regulon sensor histidine kinase PhoR